MDDYSINSLTESKNEWCARLVSILSHTIIQGINSIYEEAIKLCTDKGEDNKYLMTFQNLLSRIPEWNSITIENETKRIENVSGCKYLEDLISCVHIIQLKALTCIRVGLKQKKIDLDIPSLDKFIHKIYINTARKLYTNIYLFEKDLFPLQIQKNNRELELLVKESILTTIRDNIPVEHILRVYMEETEEEEIEKESLNKENFENKEEIIENKLDTDSISSLKEENIKYNQNKEITQKEEESKEKDLKEKQNLENLEENNKGFSIDFSNLDSVFDDTGTEKTVEAPKDLETLEKISENNKEKRLKQEEEEQKEKENEDSEKLEIGDDIKYNIDTINLDSILELDDNPILEDVEVL